MKTKNFKNNDFSKQFNNLTLREILKSQKIPKQNPFLTQNKNNLVDESALDVTHCVIERYNLEQAKKRSLSFENFNHRMLELDPVIPERYVWHASTLYYGEQRLDRFSIATRGLMHDYSRYAKAVFAHNRIADIRDFYPLIVDFMDYEYGESNGSYIQPEFLEGFDFWRIDTRVFKGKWYIDPNMKEELVWFDRTRPINYICTPENIPPAALKLYEFDFELFNFQLPYLMKNKNDPNRLPASCIKPVAKVNQWIEKLRTAA